jgi:hypothetical protein
MSDERWMTAEEQDEARRYMAKVLARVNEILYRYPIDAEVILEINKSVQANVEEIFKRVKVLDTAGQSLKGNRFAAEPELSANSITRPPRTACLLLDLLLSKADRETIPGDLVEEFGTSILPKYGPRQAQFWFWAQAVRAIARRNPLSRWVLVYGLGRVAEWIFKAIGS